MVYLSIHFLCEDGSIVQLQTLCRKNLVDRPLLIRDFLCLVVFPRERPGASFRSLPVQVLSIVVVDMKECDRACQPWVVRSHGAP